MEFEIIYADPPWDYKGQKQHNGKGGKDTGSANKYYETLKLKDLKTIPVYDIAAKDSLLFIWVTSPHLNQGVDLIKSWGFKYSTVGFVWNKVKINPSFYTMSQCELCLIAKKGKIPQPRGARNIRQYIEEMRRKHSQKPDAIKTRINKMFPSQKKLELFAREPTEDWYYWGNEVNSNFNLNDIWNIKAL
jgi:N6-adenosine-specific RNA methylase IME4